MGQTQPFLRACAKGKVVAWVAREGFGSLADETHSTEALEPI